MHTTNAAAVADIAAISRCRSWPARFCRISGDSFREWRQCRTPDTTAQPPRVGALMCADDRQYHRTAAQLQ